MRTWTSLTARLRVRTASLGQQPAYPQAQGNQPPGDDSGQAQLLQPYVEQQEGSSGQLWPQQAYQPAQALDATQLEQLVAPIALYPDSLVAVILAASTYPDQIAQAAQWRQAQGDASADQIAAAADLQNWDASVKALTAFPQVLSNLDANMQWTVALGNAYYNQSQDVLWAVQRMRYRAQEAGNLESTPQQVVGEDQGSMQIVPENPQVVYVPMYNPWVVYGAPIAPYPGFSLFGAIGSVINSVVSFGVGMVMTPFIHVGWGCTGWGLNWASQSVLFHHSIYYSRSRSVADWGLPHGGPRAFAAARSTAYAPPRYGMAGGGGGYGTQSSQAFAGTQRGYGEGSNRAYAGPSPGYNRQPLEAYNRAPQTYSRPGLPANAILRFTPLQFARLQQQARFTLRRPAVQPQRRPRIQIAAIRWAELYKPIFQSPIFESRNGLWWAALRRYALRGLASLSGAVWISARLRGQCFRGLLRQIAKFRRLPSLWWQP